jgi:peroxiredoxin
LSRAWARCSAIGAVALWLGACSHTASLPTLSTFLPALQLPAVGAVPYSYSGLRGQVVLVTFLATWCFPCIGQLPILEKAQRQYGERGFRIVAVGMDLEGAEVLEPFAREYALPFPLLVADHQIRNGQTAFGPISALPSSFLFGRDGRLITAFAGLPVPAQLEELIARALDESPQR